MSGGKALRVATARPLTPKELADATRLVRRRAVSPDDEQQLLDELGLTEEVEGQ